MTGGEADLRGAVPRGMAAASSNPGEPVTQRSPATAGHAITVLVPDERPPAVRYAVAVASTALALAATLPMASVLQRVILVLF